MKILKSVGIAALALALANSANAIPKEKVLTVSAKDYVASQGKTLNDYVMVGVSDCVKKSLGKDIPSPDGTEVIVNYQFGVIEDKKLGNTYCYAGTALVPVTPTAKSTPKSAGFGDDEIKLKGL